ncbi:putative CocE/NonD family hydrolase [Planomicrobium soli]|uniref:Putative CocE/NonD family hydrolase n=1 Tax=Planomicrobium soli TaxID=1176648 RepID=A0A2P8H3J5_9BACL|nr:CocE/NonD family hydrolase [Planomicrobium soli]PSL40778.1 putative CocE/NonD family hydrolase [Planomicrobium soli]
MKLHIIFILFFVGIVFSMFGFVESLDTYYEEKALARPTETSIKGKGTLERKWVVKEEKMSHEKNEVRVIEDINIKVRDGIILKGRLLLPKGVKEPLPTIVQLNGYGHESDRGKSETKLMDLAERGYAVVHVSLRGTGTSEGKAGLYNFYSSDGYDVIEWAAEQGWSNGKVGTIGLSLLGISQWLAAKELPPSLKAISPAAACADCYEMLWHPGGMEAGPGRIARSVEYKAAKEHRNFDGWWQERVVSTEDLNRIAKHGVAAFITGGWNDYISPDNIEAFEQYSKTSIHSKLIVSSDAHTYLSGVMPYGFEDYQAQWFDHYLKDKNNGVNQHDPVLIYVQGANQWRYEKKWPLIGTNYIDFYLTNKKSDSINSINDGLLIEEKTTDKEATAMYEYSPETGPFLPTLLSATGRLTINQQPYEKQTLTWTTGALAEPTEITGNLSMTFWAAVNAEDADFVVQITDAAPNGTSRQVTAGYLNAARANSLAEPIMVEPGKIKKYTIKIYPTSYVFKKGHRIRLSLAGGTKAFPKQKSPQGPGINPIGSTVIVYQGSKYPSSLRLPVIGQETLELDRRN